MVRKQRCEFDTEDKTGHGRKHRKEYQRNQACQRNRIDGAGSAAGVGRDPDDKGKPCENREGHTTYPGRAVKRDKERAGDELRRVAEIGEGRYSPMCNEIFALTQ